MRLLIILFAISRLSDCSLQYHGVTVGFTPYSAPVHSQYHSQNIYGQYSYGYATGLSSKDEVKTPDGVVRGGYSYIDANGILQTVHYVADPVHGFRVVATNLPRDLPEVAHARAQHLAQFEYIKAEHAAIAASRRNLPPAISPLPITGTFVVPVHAAAVPSATYAPVSGQFHAQDGHGQYTYGYADHLSAKSETKTSDGVTQGGYSYIDPNGLLQTVQYVSDPVNGFRVAGTNIPEALEVEIIGPKVEAAVVGPQENKVGTDAVIAPAANLVPVQPPLVEQRPVLLPEIVQNANIPLAAPIQVDAGRPYIHPNPNHEPPVINTSPVLGAPFHVALPYAEGPIYDEGYAPINRPEVIPAPHDNRPIFSQAAPILRPQQDFIAPNHANQLVVPPGAPLPVHYERVLVPQRPNPNLAPASLFPPPNYHAEFQSGPINADTINHGSVNQPLNFESAGQLQEALGPNPIAATGFDAAGERLALFVPNHVLAAQQVPRFQDAPVDDRSQVGPAPDQQGLYLGVPEQPGHEEQRSGPLEPATDQASPAAGPSGYYTTNIQY